MKIVNINNNSIDIFDEKSNFISLPLEKGVVLNGVILNYERLKAIVADNVNVFKNAKIVIDSSNIVIKVFMAPKLKKDHLIEVAKREFNLNSDDYVYGMNVLEKKNRNLIIAYAVPKDLIEPYSELFSKCKIDSIDFSINMIINYVRSNMEYKEKTFALNVVNDNLYIAVMFYKGEYSLTSRGRIINDKGTDAYYRELANMVLTNIDFYKSQKFEGDIDGAYFQGMNENDFQSLKSILINEVNYPNYKIARVFDDESAFVHFNSKVQSINLNNVYIDSLKKKIKINKMILIDTIVVLLVLISSVGFIVVNTLNDKFIKEQSELLAETKNKDKIQEFNNLLLENQNIANHMSEIKDLKNKLSKITILDGKKLEKLNSVGKIVNVSYNSADDVVNISYSVSTASQSSEVVRLVRELNIIKDLNYTGYNKAGDSYILVINGKLRESKGE
ncbi:MAG: cell division protein FtsL [Erysipelotrichaceae bacterium]